MGWIAAAIVFCFLMWKWPKKTIILSICVFLVSCIVSLCIYGYCTYEDYKTAKQDRIEKEQQKEKERQDAIDELNRRATFGKNIELIRHKNDINRKCSHYLKMHESHHIFTITNNNDIDITNFKIFLSAKLKGHSSKLVNKDFEYDIIVPKHGKSISFCINFIEDTNLSSRIPQAKGDYNDMVNRGVEILDYDNIDFDYYLADVKNGDQFLGSPRLAQEIEENFKQHSIK